MQWLLVRRKRTTERTDEETARQQHGFITLFGECEKCFKKFVKPRCGASGGICGFVFNAVNNNGIQDSGDTGVGGAKVFLVVPGDVLETDTGSDGCYYFSVPEGTYTIFVQIAEGPANPDTDFGFVTPLVQ